MESRSSVSLLTHNTGWVLLLALLVNTSSAQVLMTKEEALSRFFPSGARIERRTVFLTQQQVQQIEQRAKARLESKVVTYYVGKVRDSLVGYAFFETHVVRTMPETFMLLVSPAGFVQAVEILAFYEPEDYLPPKRWLHQFQTRTLDDELWVKRGIQAISGATLSAQAITGGVRRLLATFQIAVPREDAR
ncbi:MAG TPA: FMN-binding protein [Bacteroidota bacterium]|nr:FMN-binding protein [Bacteroidota bacterium]